VVAPADFQNAEKGDYRFKAGSAANRLGIGPIDVSRAGRWLRQQ
jgi:hypothetical protein